MDKRYYRHLEKFKDPIITAYTEHNMTMQEIADQYDSSASTVYRLLKKYKVKTRRCGQRFYEDRIVAEERLNANIEVNEPYPV